MNLRNVKKTDNGYCSLKKSQLDLHPLCEVCGLNNHCKIQKRYKPAKDHQAMIIHCERYQFPLIFQQTKGLNQPFFNTIRLGRAWANRLEPKARVSLLDTSHTYIGDAIVEGVELESKQNALDKHANMNHLLVEDQLESTEASDCMHKILRNAYGKMVFENASELSIIYLKPVNNI